MFCMLGNKNNLLKISRQKPAYPKLDSAASRPVRCRTRFSGKPYHCKYSAFRAAHSGEAHGFTGHLKVRFWPKADPNITQFLPIRTAAFGKSGHSGVGRSEINLERPLYPRKRTFS